MKTLQKIALRMFLTCMVATATLVLYFIWTLGPGPDSFGITNQLIITCFVVGLASFLVWLVTIILEIRDKIQSR